jgi:hypothetical protein
VGEDEDGDGDVDEVGEEDGDETRAILVMLMESAALTKKSPGLYHQKLGEYREV